MKPSRLYVVEGIILKGRTYGEADRILTVFTREHGKMRVIAKGVRKISSRRAGHLEVFSHVTLTIHASSSLDIVTEAVTVRPGRPLAADILRMGYAYCLCELVDQLLPDRQEHYDVFMLLSTALGQLHMSQTPQQWQAAISGFVHKLLWILGYLPQTQKLSHGKMQQYIEHITERKLRTWSLLTNLRDLPRDDTIEVIHG